MEERVKLIEKKKRKSNGEIVVLSHCTQAAKRQVQLGAYSSTTRLQWNRYLHFRHSIRIFGKLWANKKHWEALFTFRLAWHYGPVSTNSLVLRRSLSTNSWSLLLSFPLSLTPPHGHVIVQKVSGYQIVYCWSSVILLFYLHLKRFIFVVEICLYVD